MSREAEFPRVVATKLVAPRRRPETISRDRVRRLLEQVRERPLTVVCAPAGSGKTTALADWCRQLDGGYAWISLHEQDNDPRRLCAQLLAALDGLWPTATWAAEQALLGGSDLVETVVPLATEGLAEQTDGQGLVIVLDDYHVIAEPACHRLLSALVDALPDDVCVVIASRTRPPLRLARRRAARTVAEVGAAELAFDGDEAQRLLNGSLRLRLQPEQVETIRDRVEGWAAGLSLVASSLRHDRDRDRLVETLERSQGRIAEYLIEEVLDAVPPRIRDFLRRTSVLPRMNAALSAAVMRDPRAVELFAEVRRSNLFAVAIDGAEGWVRYQTPFAELLQRDLRRCEPSSAPELHYRASLWFEHEGMTEEAVEHATEAGDGERAARLLHDSWWTLVAERRYVTVRRTIARMPPQRGALGPFCDALDALCMSLEGADPRLVARRLDALERDRAAPGVAAILDPMRISPYYGDVAKAVADGWRVWSGAAEDPQMRARQAGKFATVLWFAGDRDALHRVVEPYMGMIDRPALRSWELAALALSAAEGDLEAAERHAREAVEIAEESGGESALESHLAYVALAEALRHRGRFDEAHDQITRALRTTRKLPGSVYHALALAVQAQLDLASRDRRAARTHAFTARRIIDSYPDVGLLTERLASVEAALERPRRRVAADSEPTEAERRVLELLPTDLTRRQIAAELELSVATVKTHAWRLYRRLGATTRAEAVAIARERGLL